MIASQESETEKEVEIILMKRAIVTWGKDFHQFLKLFKNFIKIVKIFIRFLGACAINVIFVIIIIIIIGR